MACADMHAVQKGLLVQDYTSVFSEACNNQAEVWELLVKHGANLDKKDTRVRSAAGHSLLMVCAASHSHKQKNMHMRRCLAVGHATGNGCAHSQAYMRASFQAVIRLKHIQQ